jgi:hypothetical protein
MYTKLNGKIRKNSCFGKNIKYFLSALFPTSSYEACLHYSRKTSIKKTVIGRGMFIFSFFNLGASDVHAAIVQPPLEASFKLVLLF